MTIRPMAPEDLEPATALCSANGWTGMAGHFAFNLSHPRSQPFVAEVDGAVVGTGVAICRGAVGWVGLISVRAEFRRSGLGTALLQIEQALAGESGRDTVQIALPAENRAGLAHLETEGFSLVRRLPRMRWGEPSAWRPESVWSRMSGAMA